MGSITKQHGPQNRVTVTDDLLVEIFSRLPPRSLLRFKCVSKAWYHLISYTISQNKLIWTMSGLFYQVYYTRTRSNWERKVEYIDDPCNNNNISHLSLSFLPFLHNLRMHDCCNGLLLCSSPSNQKDLYVCNPTTKKWVAIPRPQKRASCFALAFDPHISPHYTVVLFRRRLPRGSDLETFSSETGKWMERDVCLGPKVKQLCRQLCAFFNGVLHILSSPRLLVGIDLKEMRCRIFELPETATIPSGCLGQSGGYLHYASWTNNTELQIWMLKDYSANQWVLKHTCNQQALVEQQQFQVEADIPSTSNITWRLDVLAFHPDFVVVFLQVRGKLCSYHLSCVKLEEICSLGHMREPWFFPFSPCLQELLDWHDG